MKKIILCLMVTALSLTFVPLQSNAATLTAPDKKEATKTPTASESAEAKALQLRLDEINAMDKSELKASEKKSLRKEVKAINHSMREISGGVYLSVGAILLIALLLIILL
jgi:hypothetical protein